MHMRLSAMPPLHVLGGAGRSNLVLRLDITYQESLCSRLSQTIPKISVRQLAVRYYATEDGSFYQHTLHTILQSIIGSLTSEIILLVSLSISARIRGSRYVGHTVVFHSFDRLCIITYLHLIGRPAYRIHTSSTYSK
jgi:hypothetical protein